MKAVKVGTRLTLVLLLALTPVVAVYTEWSVARSIRTYCDDLTRETRASTRALRPAVENDLRVNEWDQIRDVLQRMSRDGMLGTLFDAQGKPWHDESAFPRQLAPSLAEFAQLEARGFAEFGAEPHLAPRRLGLDQAHRVFDDGAQIGGGAYWFALARVVEQHAHDSRNSIDLFDDDLEAFIELGRSRAAA